MLKKYFVAGLLIWLPLAATLWVLDFIVSTMDRTLLLLPQGWRPDALFGVHIPGFGLVLSVTVLLLTEIGLQVALQALPRSLHLHRLHRPGLPFRRQ